MDPFKKPTFSGSTIMFAPPKSAVPKTEAEVKILSEVATINLEPKAHIYLKGVNFNKVTLPTASCKYLLLADISGSNDSAATELVGYYRRMARELSNGVFHPLVRKLHMMLIQIEFLK